jgi:hypothetical protein
VISAVVLCAAYAALSSPIILFYARNAGPTRNRKSVNVMDSTNGMTGPGAPYGSPPIGVSPSGGTGGSSGPNAPLGSGGHHCEWGIRDHGFGCGMPVYMGRVNGFFQEHKKKKHKKS